jgi:putative polyketide hydroxylase
MPSATTLEAPVLVVGAGPAGLAAAAELTRHGIPTLLVERRTRLSSHPRATVLSLRSMELMRAWGLEAEVRERSVEVDWRMLQSETLADAADGTALPVGYPSPEESRMISPTAPACVAQDDVEPLLLDHLRAAPRARVELAAELTGLLAGADGIRASVRDVRTGAPRTVHARYLVAADGARSAVRGALGIRLIGPESLMEGFTTLFRAPLWELLGERRHILYSVTHSATPGTFLPTAPADRWLFGLSGSADDVPDARQAAKLIRLGAGAPDLPVRIERSKHFSATAQLAEQWRSGRTSSWPATPRIASRRGAGPASTWRCTTATTSAGGSAGCCAAGPARGCWTGTKPSAGRSPSTPPRGRRTPPAPSARPSRRCAPTSAAGSPTSGPENARRSTCSSGA